MNELESLLKINNIPHQKEKDFFIVYNTIIKCLYLKDDSELIKPEANKLNKEFYKKYQDNNRLVFFEDEIINKKDIVISMIKGSLKIFNKKYRASDLEYKDFQPKDYIDFFNLNHIDGYTPSTFGKGLFLNDELICGMIFRRPFTKGGGGWELSRFCTKLNTKVHGGASRILKYWDEGLLITYSNNRFSNGNVYKSIGFESLKSSKDQSYFYTDFKKRIFRTSCRKINKEEYKKYTERQQAKMGLFSEKFGHSDPVYRIYDLGQKKWIYNKNDLETRNVYIYKLTSPNGKNYIGISYDPDHRIYQHISDEKGSMYKVFKKYGKENIKKEVIYIALGRQNAMFMEKIFISQYKTYTEGYNRSEGGEGYSGGRKLNEDLVLKIKDDLRNKPYSYRKIAEIYNVSEVTIRQIKKGDRWSHIGEKYTKKIKSHKQASTKLTIDQVREIKKLLTNNQSRSEIADKYSVKKITIDKIAIGENWGHVDVEGFKIKIDKNCANKLTREIVEQIREDYKLGKKQVELVRKYGVSRTTIKNIIDYKTWK